RVFRLLDRTTAIAGIGTRSVPRRGALGRPHRPAPHPERRARGAASACPSRPARAAPHRPCARRRAARFGPAAERRAPEPAAGRPGESRGRAGHRRRDRAVPVRRARVRPGGAPRGGGGGSVRTVLGPPRRTLPAAPRPAGTRGGALAPPTGPGGRPHTRPVP